MVGIKDQGCPQAVNVHTLPQPDRVIEKPPNVHIYNSVHHPPKDSGSESEQETWSFDKAINEIFRFLPEEMCPRPLEDHTPSRPLSGTEQLMELHSTPLQVRPQSKLVENITKYIQNKLYTDKLGQDWTCPQQLVKLLALMRYYKSESQYFPSESITHIDTEASQLDISSRGKISIPIKNMEIWEKRARNLVAINSHADLFSSAAYLCLQQESMSVNALSRLLEAVAKSIKHATAMSTILAIELFQARRNAAVASSKFLKDHFSHELRNAPINSQQLFDSKVKEVAKSNFEAQQHRFLASACNTNLQQQKSSYSATGPFRKPKQPTKASSPKQNQRYRSKNQSQSYVPNTKKDLPKRSSYIRQLPSSKPVLSSGH